MLKILGGDVTYWPMYSMKERIKTPHSRSCEAMKPRDIYLVAGGENQVDKIKPVRVDRSCKLCKCNVNGSDLSSRHLSMLLSYCSCCFKEFAKSVSFCKIFKNGFIALGKPASDPLCNQKVNSLSLCMSYTYFRGETALAAPLKEIACRPESLFCCMKLA